jgi:hypothetical protein
MDYNEFLKRLEGVSPVDAAVDRLFERARKTSEQRFCLTILDLHRVDHDGERMRLLPSPGWYLGVAQFGEYLGQVASLNPGELENDAEKRFYRRMQMLAYAQCWEHLTIQRLLFQLVRICGGEHYDANLLWENWKKKERPCASIYQQIVSKAKKAHLEIAELIEVIYSNQIRNAFSHSQFYFVNDLVSFENCNSTDHKQVPSLKVSTWDKLFEQTRDFVIAVFRNRRDAEAEPRKSSPFKICLDELGSPFQVRLDERGEWTSA